MADGAVKYAQGKTPRLYQAVRGEWRLTIAERRRILLGHIYGVDIDSQAVEVTKLSLLLKVLEGESGDQIARQMNMFHIRALPDLSNNIQCGNSLIGPDFFESRPLDLGDSSIVERVNAFDWWRRFDKIMQEGGFSVIIGNPPYRRELDYKYLMDEIAVTKFGGKYRSPRMDLWYYFVHRGIELLASNGRLGFIVNSYWLYGTGAEKLISQLRKEDLLEEIFYLGELPVFRNVSGSHMILLLRKPTAKRTVTIRQCVRSGETSAEPFATGKAKTIEVDKDLEDVFHDNKIDISLGGGRYLRHLERCPRLGDLGIVRQGIAENPAAINKKTAQKFKGNVPAVVELGRKALPTLSR